MIACISPAFSVAMAAFQVALAIYVGVLILRERRARRRGE